MGFFDRFRGQPSAQRARPAVALLDGPECGELVAAVGEANYQPALSRICGSTRWEDVRFDCIATLTPEPDNPHDAGAIAVSVDGQLVGYLSRADARSYAGLLSARGPVACRARIAGRGPGSETKNLGIFLQLPPPAIEAPGDDPVYAEPADYDELPVLKLRLWDYGAGVEESAKGFGFETPDGRIWPAGKCTWTTWPELGVLVISAVGESFHREDLDHPSFDPGQPLQLVPEPDNPHDAKAISIRNKVGDRTAGYVKKGSTSRLRNLLRGHDFRVMALSCRVDPQGQRSSLKVAIFRPDRLLGAEHVPSHAPLES